MVEETYLGDLEVVGLDSQDMAEVGILQEVDLDILAVAEVGILQDVALGNMKAEQLVKSIKVKETKRTMYYWYESNNHNTYSCFCHE